MPCRRKAHDSAPRCGSPRQGNKSPCKRPAGWGTKHPGQGRCKLHGGNNESGPEAPAFKHGRYAFSFQGKLREKFAEAASDDDPLNVLPELAAQRAVFNVYVQRLAGNQLRALDAERIMAWAETITRTAERIVKSRNETALTVAEIRFLQIGILGLINDFIPDPDQRRAFVARLAAYIPRRVDANGEDGVDRAARLEASGTAG